MLVGLLAGGTIAFLFSSLAIRAVGRAAAQVVVECATSSATIRDMHGLLGQTRLRAREVNICTKTIAPPAASHP